MRADWQALSVSPDASLRDVIKAIDRGRIGIALVVDSDAHLLGTVTDGDLRRAILRGDGIESRVSAVMNRTFASVGEDSSQVSVLEVMQAHSIKQVPVLDNKGRVLGVCYLPDFIGQSGRPNWAVIMAGGEGRRLWPLTADTPKPMLPVGDRPLLENIVNLLIAHGFRELFISIRYLGDQIESYFGDGKRMGCSISYLKESTPLGTAGALSLLPERPRDDILIVNGDLLTDVNLSALMEYHADAGCLATQCVREYSFQIPFGVVRCQDGRVVETEEKPVHRLLINAGIYVLSPALLGLLPVDQEFTMPDLLAKARQNGYGVAAFPIRERWEDIGQPQDYYGARNKWVMEKSE